MPISIVQILKPDENEIQLYDDPVTRDECSSNNSCWKQLIKKFQWIFSLLLQWSFAFVIAHRWAIDKNLVQQAANYKQLPKGANEGNSFCQIESMFFPF